MSGERQMMRLGDRVDGVAVTGRDGNEEQGSMDVKERASGGTLKSLITGVREWVTVVGAYEPANGLADRSRNRSQELDARRLREQTRLL